MLRRTSGHSSLSCVRNNGSRCSIVLQTHTETAQISVPQQQWLTWQCLYDHCKSSASAFDKCSIGDMQPLTFKPIQSDWTTDLLKPKFHYADFHRNFPAGKVADTNDDKSWNHEVSAKVADTNHESRGHKPSWHVKMFATKYVTTWQVRDKPVCVALMEFSPLQCTGKVGNKVGVLCHGHKSRKSATQIMKVGNMIFVADFHDLCPRLCRELVPDFIAKSA